MVLCLTRYLTQLVCEVKCCAVMCLNMHLCYLLNLCLQMGRQGLKDKCQIWNILHLPNKMFKILIMNVSGNNQLFERKDFLCPQKDNRKTIIYSNSLILLLSQHHTCLNENSFTLVDISDEILCLCEVGHIFHCALLNMKILHRLKTRIMS